eukprot:CAMPEP_0194575838 /NCGR_PEP_ID=MMETSP0292-20121207/11171_1 /TAXON_ID=39354 /ORGANISM="Heterosigma akashiwo, Strain CCMP2393" /LENGTH=350 /DNA_ID=CAMNT_0039427723 /DNA_START=235 /DNA_END=1284 /DNA_ORIENTATION=-
MASIARRPRSDFADVPLAPPDAIFGLNEAFRNDPNPNKVSLGVGAYRDDEGRPFLLPSVRQAEEELLAARLDHEYAGIDGLRDFVDLSLAFAYGADSEALAAGRVAGVQAVSGTGALRLGAEFLAGFLGRGAPVYLPAPTWGNHSAIMRAAGLEPREYAYLDAATGGVDFPALLAAVRAAPAGSVFLLHACAHNPTGADPDRAQWAELSAALLARGHRPFFDAAYQGFATGDAEADAWALRRFAADGHGLLLAQSFSKNFGLYGQRVGCLSAVGRDAGEAARLLSQLKAAARPMYSNPPLYGARVVARVLGDPVLRARWAADCRGMAERIARMRGLLRRRLEAREGGRRR